MVQAIAHDKVDRFDSPQVSLHRLILSASIYLERAVDRALAALDLSATKFSILLLLSKAEGHALSPTQFGRSLGLERSNWTSILDRMERDGLVQRQRHPTDRRALLIHLTDEGGRVLEQAIAIYDPLVVGLINRLTPEEQAMTESALSHLTADVLALH